MARNYALSFRNWMAVPRQPRRNLAKFVRKEVGHVRLETIKMEESFCYVVLFQSFLMLGDVQFDNAYVSKRVETTTSVFCDPKIVAVVFGAKE